MNFATYVEPIAVRDDDESVPDFKARARVALAERGGGCLTWDSPDEVEWVDALSPAVVNIEGGIAENSSGRFATVGDSLIARENDETLEAFCIRVGAAAVAAGSSHVTFGRLPPMNYD